MIEEILQKYDISPDIILEIKTGLINKTYKIQSRQGNFILQKINRIYGIEVIEDIKNISKYLNSENEILPKMLATKRGDHYVKRDDDIWRLFEFVEGNVYEVVNNGIQAYEAGFILGQFHRSLKDIDYVFKTKLSAPHNSQKIFNNYLKVIEGQRLLPEIIEISEQVRQMPNLFIEARLREIVTHGDPKISNIIFSTDGKRAIKLIDIDGCNRNNVVVELGDAFRSWCGKEEDDSNNDFDLDKFESSLAGYIKGSGNLLLESEKDLIVRGIKLVALELAAKFLKDYFEDFYFDWNSDKYSSRKEHNFARARGQVALYTDIIKKEERMRQIIFDSGKQRTD